MAELVVSSHSRSSLRKTTEAILNMTFPVWGIGGPLAIGLLGIIGATANARGELTEPASYFTAVAMIMLFSVSCLSLKRFLAYDSVVVDQTGIKLPRFSANGFALRTSFDWGCISRLEAMMPGGDLRSARIAIYQQKGRPVTVALNSLDPGFAEQFLLAVNMWAPHLAAQSLQDLQEQLRQTIDHERPGASFTTLWEEELGRRFCPANYVTLEPGRVLRNCKLKVISHLASGGLSSLYLSQLDGKQLVVLKEAVVPDDSPEYMKEKAAELFQRESELLIKLDHPNIVKVLDQFVENGRNYMLLEYVSGMDLRQLVTQNGPQSEVNVLDWAISIASTLKYLHERERPVIHRDLTPDNIVLRSDGQVIIVDFGAANEFIGNATGTFIGKHSFIAPEQLRGKANTQSDIYAFGCTLFFLLTGQEPEALCPSNVREYNANVSQELSELIERCTQLEVADRYQSFSQIIPALKGIAAECVVL